MSKLDGYLQFPISILSKSLPVADLIEHAASYAVIKLGASLLNRPSINVDLLIAKYFGNGNTPTGVDLDDRFHKQIVAGSIQSGYIPQSWSCFIEHCKTIDETLNCNSGLVRIRTNIALSARDENWPLMKFKVLCGVVSSIGNVKYRRLTIRLIRARAAGHNSPKGLPESDLASKSATGRWLEKLWQSNFFQRVANGKIYWYSIRHSSDKKLAAEVRKDLANKKTKQRVSLRDDPSVDDSYLAITNCGKTLSELGFATYQEYLSSDLWKTIRNRVMQRFNHKCISCQQVASEVHHGSYDAEVMKGNDDRYLVSLCGNCHRDLEFDGDRKRTRSEVEKLDRHLFDLT